MRTPAVSFVLPCHNAEAYLEAAVESVLGQTFTDFEIIAIDDGSTDRTREILRNFRDDRLLVREQPNAGIVATLNRGILEARGLWIARMDADDLCLPDRLSQQLAYVKDRPEIALLGGWVSTIDESDRVLASTVPFPTSHEEIWRSLGVRPWVMCHPAVIFRRDAAIEAGMYDPAYRHAEDTEFFARLMTRHQAASLSTVVLKYRIRRSAISSVHRNHGSANAALVGRLIARWNPGEVFAATPAERADVETEIARSVQKITPRGARATYHCRVGRELLRGRNWKAAWGEYARAATFSPLRLEAYKGIVAATLHVGAAKTELPRQAALI